MDLAAVPGTMRAAVLRRVGGWPAVERVPTPLPGAGEVLVRVAACGVCHSDLHVCKGEIAFPLPAVLGHEVSGTVAAVGPGVSGLGAGERLSCTFILPCGSCRHCAAGRDDMCQPFYTYNRLRGVLYDGTSRLHDGGGATLAMYSMAGLAEFAVVPATAVFPLPPELPLETSAVLGCAALTAYGAVRHGADLRAGARVAVVAVGGVGTHIVEVARAFGARQVIAVDTAAEKVEAALRAGATHGVVAGSEDPVAAVRRMTGGEGVDVAFEALGRPATFAQAVEMARDGGRMVAVGLAAGDASASLPITRLVRRGLTIVGSYGARVRSDMPQVLALAADGCIRPERTVTRRYTLEQVGDAYAALDRGEIVGRAIIEP